MEKVYALIEKTKIAGKISVPPIKSTFFKIPSVMEALTEIGSYPLINPPSSEDYLEKQNSQEEEDFYVLRKRFAQLVEEVLQLNRITALLLGEAFAKKVRYGVTYSEEIENIIVFLSTRQD